jgi:hypothetical protein
MKDRVEKKPFGRPSKYLPEYCQKMLDFFSIDPVHDRVKSRFTKSNGEQTETTEETGAILPTFTRFALKIGVCDDTLEDWCKVHPDFFRAYVKCKKLQEDVWKINALKGTYNGAFAIFLGKNVFGYKDKTEVEQNLQVTMMPSIKLTSGETLQLEVGDDPEALDG